MSVHLSATPATRILAGVARAGAGAARCLRVAAWLAALIALVGCSGPRVAPPATGPKTAAAILARAAAAPMPQTLQGMTRLEAFVQGKARKADVLVRIARPDRAQFQALSPTMDLIAVMATDGQRFVSFERGADRCFKGRACPSNLARLVPIALPADELVSALLGRPPLLDATRRQAQWDGERGAWQIRIGDEGARRRQEVWVQPGSWRFLASVLYEDGQRTASIAYGDLSEGADPMPPRRMRLQLPLREVDMSIELRDVTMNEPIEAEAFSIPCPAGTMHVTLPCEATEAIATGSRGGSQ